VAGRDVGSWAFYQTILGLVCYVMSWHALSYLRAKPPHLSPLGRSSILPARASICCPAAEATNGGTSSLLDRRPAPLASCASHDAGGVLKEDEMSQADFVSQWRHGARRG
jgi:hypothetical protein